MKKILGMWGEQKQLAWIFLPTLGHICTQHNCKHYHYHYTWQQVSCNEGKWHRPWYSLTDIKDIETTQEEADSRIILHAAYAAKSCSDMVIRSPDTDVFVLTLILTLIILQTNWQSPVFPHSQGTRHTHNWYKPITHLSWWGQMRCPCRSTCLFWMWHRECSV